MIDWPQIIFTADAMGDRFDDVQLISTKHEFVNAACTAAADVILSQGLDLTPTKVLDVAKALVDQGKIHVSESVSVVSDKITVCLDHVDLEADESTFKAINMVSTALNTLEGATGTVYFGQPKFFDWSEASTFLIANRINLRHLESSNSL